uniref:Uncharacterized protein n=1 Tax=Rhizophora mucronata TaxID=61149 RepID=A0A2P2JW47_RHIMU
MQHLAHRLVTHHTIYNTIQQPHTF